MGRWGPYLFEGDTDLDAVGIISEDAGIELYNYELQEGKEAEEYDFGGKGLEATRDHLNNGVLKKLFSQYAASETDYQGIYSKEMSIVLLAAFAMRVGATIPDIDMQTLRMFYTGELFDEDESNFGGPMKTQFKLALDHYNNDGTPYDFSALRCKGPGCNKANYELTDGKTLQSCGKCKAIRYCSTECQKAHWKKHKKV